MLCVLFSGHYQWVLESSDPLVQPSSSFPWERNVGGISQRLRCPGSNEIPGGTGQRRQVRVDFIMLGIFLSVYYNCVLFLALLTCSFFPSFCPLLSHLTGIFLFKRMCCFIEFKPIFGLCWIHNRIITLILCKQF